MMILGIETSCDETAAAVVRDGRTLLSHVVWSQVETHAAFGGVVPELASRAHIEKIGPIVEKALSDAGCLPKDLDGIAVTRGPGLVGSLLVGIHVAKGLAAGLELPFLGVNHLESHLYSIVLEDPAPQPPLAALLVSGGHTLLARVSQWGEYEIFAETRDDAAGEAFDKVAKLLGLPYPGGPRIDSMTASFQGEPVVFPRARMKDGSADLSFSGLKTAVLYHVKALREDPTEEQIQAIVAGFQQAVVSMLVTGAMDLCEQTGLKRLLLAGGVACNRGLRSALQQAGSRQGVELFVPRPFLCTDNAAMTAALGSRLLREGMRSTWDMDVEPNWALGDRE